MASVDDFDHEIVLSNGIELSIMMSRIDVLSPILGLEGIEEDLVLDLHYSIHKTRTWRTSVLREVANSILSNLLDKKQWVLIQANEKIDCCQNEDVVGQWIDGLKILASLESDLELISWERRIREP